MFTPPINAIIIGFGIGLINIISEKIGSKIIVTGVPAKKADNREEIPKINKMDRYTLLLVALDKIVEISDEKPK